MKRLIALISTKGKTSKEVVTEAYNAYLKDKENERARIIEYADYNKNMPLKCPVCGWEGTPKISGLIEYHNDVLDVTCPKCKKMLLVVAYPQTKNDSQSLT